MKCFKFRNIRVGAYRIKSSFFLHKHDYDTKISKSWVLQFTKGNMLDPFVTYKHDYKLWNIPFIRFGYTITEI